jgi:uncharacterized protein
MTAPQLLRGLFVLLALAATVPCSAQVPSTPITPQTIAQPNPQKAQLVALHVDQNDPAIMNLALNNAQNIIAHYKALGRGVKIEVVTYGPGLFMLRDDKNPVKARVSAMALEEPDISFAACANTRENMAKAEGAPVKLLAEAKIVPSGVVHLMELQASGYAYIKP